LIYPRKFSAPRRDDARWLSTPASFGPGPTTTLAPLAGFAVVVATGADRGARSLRSQRSLRSRLNHRGVRLASKPLNSPVLFCSLGG